ncbi:hypothetical protein ACWF99_23895 [Nocardia sp. NPDC055002]
MYLLKVNVAEALSPRLEDWQDQRDLLVKILKDSDWYSDGKGDIHPDLHEYIEAMESAEYERDFDSVWWGILDLAEADRVLILPW